MTETNMTLIAAIATTLNTAGPTLRSKMFGASALARQDAWLMRKCGGHCMDHTLFVRPCQEGIVE